MVTVHSARFLIVYMEPKMSTMQSVPLQLLILPKSGAHIRISLLETDLMDRVLSDNFKFALEERVLRVESNAFYVG